LLQTIQKPCHEMDGTLIGKFLSRVVKLPLLKRPASRTPNMQTGPRDSRVPTLDVAPRLHPLNQQAFDVAKQFPRKATPHFQFNCSENCSVVKDFALSFKIVPESLFAGPVPSLANSSPVNFAYV
jgi:hypothetical protein